jgi:hypothetical protein
LVGNSVPKADTSAAPSAAGAAPTATGHDAGYLRVFVFGLFFIFGGITSCLPRPS